MHLSVKIRIICISLISVFLLLISSNWNDIYPQGIYSIHQLFHERDAKLIPDITGNWKMEGTKDEINISSCGDNFYRLTFSTVGNISVFEAVFLQLGENLMLDLLPISIDSTQTKTTNSNQLNVHNIFLVNAADDTLFLSPLNYDWFVKKEMKKELNLNFTWSENSMLLTSSTDELQKFLLEHKQNAGLFCKAGKLLRLNNGSEKRIKIDNEQVVEDIFRTEGDLGNNSICEPEFPYKEGWLGGDGDLSITLSQKTNLWIFSDSYVGMKGQQTRKGARIVSSTAAISTCDQNNKINIQYYWRNQYTNNPEPIFQTNTKRYRYWPNDAFMLKDTLYVVLHKVGTPDGPKINGQFNFELLGTTLAKITNVRNSLPDKWNIEYIPWSSVFDPNSCNSSFTIYNSYLYTFMGRETKRIFLTRLSLNSLEQPEENIEYYSKENKWKPGIQREDAAILFNDLTGGSVRYHEDLKQWVMIFGPTLLQNKIWMRTAPDLTGPWSEAVNLYNCPKLRSQDYFYCGREHAQLYNSTNRSMLVTYDCNAENATERMEIYTPRVIRLSVKMD